MLKRFFDLRVEIGQFMVTKGKPVLELQSAEWLQDLAFMVDITEHLNNLSKTLQGRNKVVTQQIVFVFMSMQTCKAYAQTKCPSSPLTLLLPTSRAAACRDAAPELCVRPDYVLPLPSGSAETGAAHTYGYF